MGVPLKWKDQALWLNILGSTKLSSALYWKTSSDPNILPPESEDRKWDQNFDDSMDTCFGTHR